MDKRYTISCYSKGMENKVQEIFNYYVLNSFAAFPEVTMTVEEAKQMMDSDLEIPKYVAKFGDDVIGFALAYRYHPAKVFDRTIKFTYFILPDHIRKGIGESFLKMLEMDCRERKIDSILVHINSLNLPSINFHLKNGFVECGRFEKIGRKFDKEFDDVWMQKKLEY